MAPCRLHGAIPYSPGREEHMAIATINPATGEELRTFTPLTEEQLEAKLLLATETWKTYRHTSFNERASMMMRAAEILEAEQETFGRIIDRKSTRLNSSHTEQSRMPSSA